MSRADAGTDSRNPADEAWLDIMLREARSPSVADAGFSAAVLARIAATPAAPAPTAVLATLRQAHDRERTVRRWTVAGTLVGALVAALAGASASIPSADPAAILMPGLALLVVSTVMAWLAISRS